MENANNQQNQAASKKLQQTQAQVDEVVGIMKTNVEKVLERDQKLSELDERADALQQGASQFERNTNILRRRMWCKNVKFMIILGLVAAVLFYVLFFA